MTALVRFEDDTTRLQRTWAAIDAKIDRALRTRIRQVRRELEELRRL